MPPDIRSFFNGRPGFANQPAKSPVSPAAKVTKKGRASRKVLDDSDDELPKAPPRKKATGTATSKKREDTPDATETTTAEYFGSKKPKKSTPTKAAVPRLSTSPVKSMPSRTSVRRGATINYSDDLHVKDEANEEDEVVDTKSRSSRGVSRTTKQAKRVAEADEDDDVDMHDVDPDDDFMVPDDDEGIVENKQATKPATSNVKKRKSHELDEEEDEEELDSKPERKKKAAPKKAASTKKAKKEDVQDSAAMQAIYDSIPTVRAPSPPPATEDDEDSKKKKFDFRAGHANTGAPPAAGSKDMPIGAENCLAGISFVFTGLLQSLGREEGKALVKRYGGKVMAAPSKKTDWVVLGSDAGPKKLGVIHDLGLRTIDEDGLFELIRRLPANGGDSKAAAKFEEQAAKEMEKVRAAVAQVDKKEKEAVGAAGASVGVHTTKVADPNTQLWTVKHAPTAMNQICGNKGQVEKLQRWLKAFPKNQRTKFKMAGSDGSGVYRAVLIHGPPGIGKTTAAHLVARLEGYDVVESNASDTRSKKLVEVGLKGVLSTTSLLGYFAGDGKEVDPNKKKLVLIMDEVDGMSAGDRGGVGALAAVCKKSQIPMILICNDRRLPKMKPFDGCTYDLPFRRPTVDQIRTRIMTINYRENMKMPPNVIDALIEGSHADIRQVVNMVSTAKLDLQVEEQNLDYDRGKQMSKAWEKHVVLRPWDIVSKILGGGMFAASSKSTLNDKAELYFNDHEFSPLMLQENYLGTNPIIGNNYHGREKDFKNLELVEQAANSISEGDLVDRMIHGTQQQWSLMPVHAIFSFVRPASFVAGSLAGHQTRFTQWLGKNSAQGKAIRQVKEIQGHMRLRSSADRNEIRQQYLPALWAQLVKKLEVEGKDSVPIIINLMDSYFLTRDDWDAIYELGVGPMDAEKVKIETQSKATFTRLYNQQNHPLPFIKASNVAVPKKAGKEKPDLEEALEESEDEELLEVIQAEEDEEDLDLTKDKYVKQPKKKKAPAAGKAKATKSKVEDEDEDEDGRGQTKGGKAAVKGKAKGKAPTKGRSE